MYELVPQMFLADRDSDIEGWMNILIVVILVVFWAIGGIIKARTKRAKEEGEEQLTDRPVRRGPQAQKEFFQQPSSARPVGPGSSRQYRRHVEQLRRRINRPRPISHGIVTEKKPMTIPVLKTAKEPGLVKLSPEYQSDVEELQDIISKPLDSPQARFSAESLLDYSDPDDLRRAILHYEILGKPLSLRLPGENIIGFG